MNQNATFDPEACVVVEDNIEALKIITDFGVIDLLHPKPPNNVAHFTFQTKTHFGCASNHVGFENEKDNGYIVVLLPKLKFTIADATKFFADVIKSTSTTKLFEFRVADVAPLGAN